MEQSSELGWDKQEKKETSWLVSSALHLEWGWIPNIYKYICFHLSVLIESIKIGRDLSDYILEMNIIIVLEMDIQAGSMSCQASSWLNKA